MDTSGRTILDPSAGKAGASAKQLFGKDELAAILRFGAEDLFKQAPPEVGARTCMRRSRGRLGKDQGW